MGKNGDLWYNGVEKIFQSHKMAVFKGQTEYSVDNKGRLAVPAKMRSVLNPEAKSTFVLTRGMDRCIFAYPQDIWENDVEARLERLNNFQEESRRFIRLLLRWADESVLDGQGRVSLPKSLVKFAEIKGRAVVVGALDHLEIWSPSRFEEYLNKEEMSYEKLAQNVLGKEDV